MTKRGRPTFQKTPEQILQVITLSGNGFPDEWIADHIKVNRKTLAKYFAEELKTSKKLAAAKLKLTIYQRGIKGEIVPALAWLNNHKWGNDGPDGPPSPLQIGISFEDGGPGRARRVPYDQEVNECAIRSTLPGADFLPDTDQRSARAPLAALLPSPLPARVGEVLPRSTGAGCTWEVLAMSAEEFARRKPG